MNSKDFASRLGVTVVLGLAVIFQSSNAFAREDRGRGQDRSRSKEAITVGHQRYAYHNGRFYRPGWLWFNIAFFHPPIGAVVSFLPFGRLSLVINGVTYYHYNNVYYRACSSGYVVVPAPAARHRH